MSVTYPQNKNHLGLRLWNEELSLIYSNIHIHIYGASPGIVVGGVIITVEQGLRPVGEIQK